MASNTPPLPRCAFRVAVVGHRWDKFPTTAVPWIASYLQQALEVIGDEVRHSGAPAVGGFASDTPDLVLLSGLAAGADQLAARVALATSGWRLHAVLPFDRIEYDRDFEDDLESQAWLAEYLEVASALTVLDGSTRREADGERAYDAYVPLGRVLVEQCDLLIAIWDGLPARGVGGTATMVRAARQADVPLLHFNPLFEGRVSLESRPDSGEFAEWTEGLRQQVSRLLAPPANATTQRGETLDQRKQYFAESSPLARRASLFDLIGTTLHRRSGERGWPVRVAKSLRWMFRLEPVDDVGAADVAAWGGPWRGMTSRALEPAVARFAEHHGWADALATHYAAAFRATYTRVFAFAWFAVLAAFAGTATELLGDAVDPSIAASIHAVCLGIEAVILLAVFANVYWGRRLRLHERWLDYRALAERLRHLAVLWPLARTTAVVRLPGVLVAGDPRTSWIGWYLRGVAREAGLVRCRFDAAHIAASRALLRDVELERQRRFHLEARDRGLAIVHPLERVGEGLFLLAMLISFGSLLHWPDRLLEPLIATPALRVAVLGALGVGLPALASGIHGFLGTSDLESTAIRSAGVAPKLEELIWRLDHLDPADSTTIGEIGAEAALVMEGELGSWRAVSAARKLQAT